MADADEITQESDPGLWQSLYNQWIFEKRPGWVVTGTKTYTVIHKTDDVIVFRYQSGESFYDTTSFG